MTRKMSFDSRKRGQEKPGPTHRSMKIVNCGKHAGAGVDRRVQLIEGKCRGQFASPHVEKPDASPGEESNPAHSVPVNPVRGRERLERANSTLQCAEQQNLNCSRSCLRIANAQEL